MAALILINLFFLLSSFSPLCLDRVSKESASFAIITLTTEGGIQLHRSYHKERKVFSANSRCAKLVLPTVCSVAEKYAWDCCLNIPILLGVRCEWIHTGTPPLVRDVLYTFSTVSSNSKIKMGTVVQTGSSTAHNPLPASQFRQIFYQPYRMKKEYRGRILGRN